MFDKINKYTSMTFFFLVICIFTIIFFIKLGTADTNIKELECEKIKFNGSMLSLKTHNKFQDRIINLNIGNIDIIEDIKDADSAKIKIIMSSKNEFVIYFKTIETKNSLIESIINFAKVNMPNKIIQYKI